MSLHPGKRGAGEPKVSAMAPLQWLVPVAFLLLITTGCGPLMPPSAAVRPDGVQIPPIAMAGARMSPDVIPARLLLPKGKGPFPAVIVLHGCAGPGPTQPVLARRLHEWGYAAVIPHSMAPRPVARVFGTAKQEVGPPW